MRTALVLILTILLTSFSAVARDLHAEMDAARTVEGLRQIMQYLWRWQGPLHQPDVEHFDAAVKRLTDSDGRVTPELQQLILEVEAQQKHMMSDRGQLAFQNTAGEIGASFKSTNFLMPEPSLSYWRRTSRGLREYRSSENFPQYVDVLIIGAGATGLSTAFYLSDKTVRGELSVAVIDRGGVAEGATGQNGGVTEGWPGNFFGPEYEDFVSERHKGLKILYPYLPDDLIAPLALEQAKIMIGIGIRNREAYAEMREAIRASAQASFLGNLRMANNHKQEWGLAKDAQLATGEGMPVEMWSPRRIQEETTIVQNYWGRFAPGFGPYHPKEFFEAVAHYVLGRNVQLYTQTSVERIEWSTPRNEPIAVRTNRGIIRARKVVVATDAGSKQLDPAKYSYVEPWVSQILTFPYFDQPVPRIAITAHSDDFYGAVQNDRTALFGGAKDRPVENPFEPTTDLESFQVLHRQIGEYFPELAHRPPATYSVGAFAFAKDRGFVYDFTDEAERVLETHVTNGFGNCVCGAYGKLTAQVLTSPPQKARQLIEQVIPRRHFGRARFLNSQIDCMRALGVDSTRVAYDGD